MAQKYKTVYFADLPGDSSQQKSLTLAFGKQTNELYDSIKDLSSAEIRQLLGTESYQQLTNVALTKDLSVNKYCLRQLNQSLNSIREYSPQLSLPIINPQTHIFDPVTVTFKGGAKEPFVRWYSYLEGYSPQFVHAILERYAPDAKQVLDPFGGMATTAFTASQRNKLAFFCEVNPVLQFISLVKIHVRYLDRSHRLELAKGVVALESSLNQLNHFAPDWLLDKTYKQTFENSEFFDDSVYQLVLKARNWVDEIALKNPLLADLATVAVLSALVPASRMKRAGDLRYKTSQELKQQTLPFIQSIRQNIIQMACDIQGEVNGFHTNPVLICEDARSLAYIPYLGIDTVITSPPYVNGTNYFRNTKIELWFLRCLTEKEDLARFRSAALTSGINDVTNAKLPANLRPEIERIVSLLNENAYDQRIPGMVACYFHEINEAFTAICAHLVPGATLAVDIGDSAYGGVHVPVDELLSAGLQDMGFVKQDDILLRQRRSRGGMLLKQVLLVFKYRPVQQPFVIREVVSPWQLQWNQFKETLPHQMLPYNKRNWGHSRHSLCSYPGKLKPAIAHHLVKLFVPEGGKVLDPFAGVGTISFEAALQGKMAYGFDLSPAALIIASAKVQQISEDTCRSYIEGLERFIKTNEPTEQEQNEIRVFGFNGKIVEYYESKTLIEIILARRYFHLNRPKTPEAFFIFASLLHILHGNRPYALSRRSHPITPYKPTGEFEYRSLIGRLTEKVYRGFEEKLPDNFQPGKIFLQDATGWWPREISELDAIITSPPFFDSTRFYLANWLRLWFSGWSQHDFQSRPMGFVDERQKNTFEVYVPILRQARERLKRDGVLVFHLGKSVKCDMAEQLKRIGKQWFRSVDVFDESVAHCESHGIRDKGTVTAHQYLVLY